MPEARHGWVHVGRALVYVGPSGRLEIDRAPSRERENAARLAEALSRPAPEYTALDRAEILVAEAGDVTSGVERATELVELLRRGADPKTVASELDALLAVVIARHREGRFADVLRLAKVLVGGLLLALRWRDLVEVTRIAADAAHALGEAAEEGWALYELATLATVAEVPSLAGELAGEARELFEQAGDHLGVELSAQTVAQASTPAAHGVAGKAAGWVTTHKLTAAAALVAVAAGGMLTATRDGSSRRPSAPVLLATGLNSTFADPAVSVDREGVVHVLWRASVPDSPAFVVVTSRRAPGGKWSAKERLSEARHSASAPQLVRRPSGELCALWDAYIETEVIGFGSSRLWERCFVGGKWTPRREVGSPSRLGGDIRSGMLGAYTLGGRLKKVLNHLGAVSYGGRLLSGDGTVYQPAFVADGGGRLHVVWLEFGRRVLHRLSRDGGLTWTPARPVRVSFGSAIDVVADSGGLVHLVTSSGGDVFYTRWTEAGGWDRETELSGELEGSAYPGVGAGPDGRATVSWSVPEGLALATQDDDGRFRPAKVIRNTLLGGPGRVRLTVGDDGFREIVVLLADGGLVYAESAP